MKRARPYNRETALDAALDLFWAKGFHATSLKDLEAALSMKPGSIYAAFSSKESLYLAALERYFENSRDTFRRIGREANSPVAALTDLLRDIGHCARQDQTQRACMLVKTVLDTTSDNAAIAERSRLYLDKIKSEITAVLEVAQEKGELRADIQIDRLARKYQSFLTALRIEAHRGSPKNELADLAEDLAEDWKRSVDAKRLK